MHRAVRSPEDQHRGYHQPPHHVPAPPCEPDGPNLLPAHVAPQRETRHPDGRAHDRTQQPGEGDEREDIPRPIERLAAVREPRHEPAAEERFERIAARDSERRPGRSRRRDVDEERAREERGPDAVPEQQRRRQRDAGGWPHRRRARVHRGQGEAHLSGDEVDAGDHEGPPGHQRNPRASHHLAPHQTPCARDDREQTRHQLPPRE